MRISGIARVVPRRVVTNDELLDQLMAHPENRIQGPERPVLRRMLREILRHAGAEKRHHRDGSGCPFDYVVEAGRTALAMAGTRPEQVDLLLYVGVGRGFLEPATSCLFQSALGLSNATCFDVLDACASWLRALDLAYQYMKTGRYARVLLLNGEFNFQEYIRWDFRSLADLEHLGVGFTVGEAATATLLEASPEDGYHATFQTSGRQNTLCQIPLPNAAQFVPDADLERHRPLRFFSYGRKLVAAAVDQLDAQFHADPCLRRYQPDVIFGHAVSVPTSRTVLDRLGLDPAAYVETFPRFGNTVSASLPVGLSVALEEGRLHRGDRVLFMMGSAGITTGFCTLRF